MGDSEEQQRKQRQKEIDDFRSHSVGMLIQIIEELAGMNLSDREIETVLRTCGLNADCAMRFGASITAEKEKGLDRGDRPVHP
jgi:hypothetical protein